MTDIALNPQGEIEIANGDLVLREAEQQDVMLIMDAHRGEWKQWALLGLGMDRYLNMPTDLALLEKDVKRSLRYDGFLNARVRIEQSDLSVTATRDV